MTRRCDLNLNLPLHGGHASESRWPECVKALKEGIGDFLRLLIIEYQLRRELQRPILPRHKPVWRWRPQPNQTGSTRGNLVRFYLAQVLAAERLNEKIAHPEGRYLRIVIRPRHYTSVIVDDTRDIAYIKGVLTTYGFPDNRVH